MPMPTLSFTGEGLYESIAPLVRDGIDEAQDFTAAKYIDSLASMFDDVADLVRDREDGTKGWSLFFDPYQCLAMLLPFLAQWEGVVVPGGMSEAETRSLIDQAPAQGRGGPWDIVAFAQRFLTGTRTVLLYERYGGNAGVLGIRTRTSETPDSALLLAAVKKFQKPGGIVLDYATVAGSTYGELDTAYGTYGDMDTAFTDYAAQAAG